MRAQVTVEYLLLSLVALMLVAFSIAALAAIRDSAAKAQASLEFRSSATDLANAINEACALGYGNARFVYLKRMIGVSGGPADPYYAEFTDSAGNQTIVKKTFCQVAGKSGLYGKVEVENKNGEITLAGSP